MELSDEGRTRRRNVRSVYATMGDHDNRSPVKEPVEQPRVTRKRLERELQEAAAVPTTPRRGRPPKTRRRADEDDETEAKEAETVKPAEGWRSPRSQKVAAGGQQGKRGRNVMYVSMSLSPYIPPSPSCLPPCFHKSGGLGTETETLAEGTGQGTGNVAI